MFRSLLYDHPQGLSFVLSAFTTFRLLASSFAFNIAADDRPTQNNKCGLNGYVTSLFEIMSSVNAGPSVESHTI
jgi:hypothetical protein